MIDIREKFTIKMTENGVNIINSEEQEMHFSASEALMLLDILKNEEKKLKTMSEKAAPIPVRIKFEDT